MTQREVIKRVLWPLMCPDMEPTDQAVAAILTRLHNEGLFVGPLVPTPEMAEAGQDFKTSKGILVTMTGAASWKAMVAEWKRGEGK